MRLSHLRDVLPEADFIDFEDVPITGVANDSRRVKPGHLFVAVPGYKEDGLRFVVDALGRGCVAVLTDRRAHGLPRVPQVVVPDVRRALAHVASHFYRNPSSALTVVGVTGTKGKTTTTYLVRSMFEAAGGKVGLLGTISYVIGEREIPAPMTTPDSVDLQGYLAQMREEGLTHAVMEVSSHALHQRRAEGIEFAAGVLTNLTRDHLDFHKTHEEYRDAKAILFEGLRRERVAVLNADDPASDEYARRTAARTVWYGMRPGMDVSAEVMQSDLDGTLVHLWTVRGDAEFRLPLIGRHNVLNLLAATATVLALGHPLVAAVEGAKATRCVPGRLEPVECGQPFHVFVDYAHTEDSLRNVISALRPLVQGRVIVVFGCGGDRDRGKRPLMGRAVEELADVAIVTSDNPRSEDPKRILEEVVAGMTDPSRRTVIADREEAIFHAIRAAAPGDVVLLAGKGHEHYQVLKDVVKPFDDREVAIRAITGAARV